MSKSPFRKWASAGRAPTVPDEARDPVRAEDGNRPGYLFSEERARAIFGELYPNEDPAKFPRALFAIIKGLRQVEEDAVALAERSMFAKGAEEARNRILALVKDPATCVDPVTRQPTASHFDWRNVTTLLAERIEALKLGPPR